MFSVDTEQMRFCNKCMKDKPSIEFGKMAGTKTGRLANQCQACVSERQRGWKEQNKQLCSLSAEEAAVLVCKRCKEEKNGSDFGFSCERKNGRTATCLACSRLLDRARYARDTEKRRTQAKWGAIKQKFGLSRQEWEGMFKQQGGACAICNIVLADSIRTRACVDHDHSTGKVRGLLCPNCNQALGLIGDDLSAAENAVAYLKRHRE